VAFILCLIFCLGDTIVICFWVGFIFPTIQDGVPILLGVICLRANIVVIEFLIGFICPTIRGGVPILGVLLYKSWTLSRSLFLGNPG
jgi:hypothetical protein